MSRDRYIPERTIDSMLAIEVVRHDPYALIWSPTNTAGAIDHGVVGRGGVGAGGLVTVFECKAVDYDGSRWRVPIDLPQLRGYLMQPAPVMYVLLGQPEEPAYPSYQSCEQCVTSSLCLACCRDPRSRADLESHVLGADVRLRLQPWFCHWAWVIGARGLMQVLRDQDPRPLPNRVRRLRASNAEMENRLPPLGGVRLCHYLEAHPWRRPGTQLLADWISAIEEMTSRPVPAAGTTAPVIVLSASPSDHLQ
jgi:hypothetical protein